MIPPLERNPRYHLLDAWRGVACLLVVLHHAGFALLDRDGDGAGFGPAVRAAIVGATRAADQGVPLFFVISGYCIAASADALRRRGSSALAFLGRRVWRIYPPYWAALAYFAAAMAGLDAIGQGRLHDNAYSLRLLSPGQLNAAQWLGNLTLTETWRPIVGGGEAEIYTRIAWSLCYEEQFYLVCFAALLLAPRRLYGALLAVTVAAVATRALAQDVGALYRIDGTFPVYWHDFAVGLAVYWRLNVPASAGARRAVVGAIVALLAVAAWTGLKATTTAAAFGLVLLATRRFDERALAWRWLDPLRACGRRCYSIYLVHLPVCTVLNGLLVERLGLTGFGARALVVVPAVMAAAVAVSFAFFALVERHFLNPPVVRPAAEARRPLVPVAGEPGAGDATA